MRNLGLTLNPIGMDRTSFIWGGWWSLRDIASTNIVWYLLQYRGIGGKQYIAQ